MKTEQRVFTDRESDVTVRQLTDYLGHSFHLYFTNPGWWDGGRRLLFGSDRDNRQNLSSIKLATGEITPITNLPASRGLVDFQVTCVNARRDEAYFWEARQLRAVDLRTPALRTLWERPEGFNGSMINVTADGVFVCGAITEDLSGRLPIDPRRGTPGFEATFLAQPLCRIFRAAVDGSRCDILREERCWIGHVNTSPTQPNLLSFCHEAPWTKVDNRIWCMDHTTGKAWKVRECTAPNECVGHEYWMADGALRPVFGSIRYDNSGRVEALLLSKSVHFHSNSLDIIVGDGSADNPRVLIWKREGDRFDGSRVVARHDGSWRVQQLHVHPRFNPDGRFVLYTADPHAYGNVYLAELPHDLNTLPCLPEKHR